MWNNYTYEVQLHYEGHPRRRGKVGDTPTTRNSYTYKIQLHTSTRYSYEVNIPPLGTSIPTRYTYTFFVEFLTNNT
jgi:hypothetical protein